MGAGPCDVVDHINQDPLDNRLGNLRLTNHSANAQNIRRTRGFIGVGQDHGAADWTVHVTVRGAGRIATKKFSDLQKAIELYDLAALYQHGRGALMNEPQRMQEYLNMLETDATRTMVKDFLERIPSRRRFYLGVEQTGPEKFLGTCCVGKGRGRKTTHCTFDGIGAEVKAAVYWDVWRLKTKGKEFTVNFEFMRPWYLHYVDSLCPENEASIIDLAYDRMGGDDFKDIRKRQPYTQGQERNGEASGSKSLGKRKSR
jgi:hypothetical protein